jgi:hypothetical protein
MMHIDSGDLAAACGVTARVCINNETTWRGLQRASHILTDPTTIYLFFEMECFIH